MFNAIRFLSVIMLVLSANLNAEDGSDASHPIHLASYNVRYATLGDGVNWWGERRESVSKYLTKLDIFGLQEVTHRQLIELREDLNHFEHYGVGRDDGEHKGEHAVIFYRSSRFQKLSEGTFWLSSQPSRVGEAGWDAALPRTCTWLKIEDIRTGKKFVIGNTHFDHRGSEARLKSSRLIRKRLSDLAGECPIVLMGDFNCVPGSDPYAELLAGMKLKDAKHVSLQSPQGPDSTWNGFDKIIPGRRIDYVFVSDQVRVMEYVVDDPRTPQGRFASDHLPVRVVLD